MAVWNAAALLPVPIEIDYLRSDWGEVGQVFRLQRERRTKDQSSREVVYGWTSLARQRCSPKLLLQLIRAH